MYIIPLVSTLLSFIFSSLLGRYLGTRGTMVTSIVCLVLAAASSTIIWYEVVIGGFEAQVDLFGSWIVVGTFNVSWTAYIDLYTAHMLLTVTGVSCAVHIYAVVYMRDDPHLSLFMAYLSLFTFFMLVLVCSSNLLVMLVGWEGTGECPNVIYGYCSHINLIYDRWWVVVDLC